MTENPWLRAAKEAAEESAARQAATPSADETPITSGDDGDLSEFLLPPGPEAPQPGNVAAAAGLPLRLVPVGTGLWLTGAHGGAGTSTLARLLAAGDAGTQWPVVDEPGQACAAVLVARTHEAGLRAAQAALTQWAAGGVDAGTRLLGLVLIPDAPGKLPKPLRELALLVAGGAPRTWQLPWVEAWRTGDYDQKQPREVARLLSDLRGALTGAGK